MSINKNEIIDNDILESSTTGAAISIIAIDNTENANDKLTKVKTDFDKNLYRKSLSTSEFWMETISLLNEKSPKSNLSIPFTEGNIITGWKLISSISARLIEVDEDNVKLECLVDKENRIYEEQEFKRSYFDGYTLEQGCVFKLCWYEKPNQVMMEVKNNPKLILEDDFPKASYATKFSDLKIRK